MGQLNAEAIQPSELRKTSTVIDDANDKRGSLAHTYTESVDLTEIIDTNIGNR